MGTRLLSCSTVDGGTTQILSRVHLVGGQVSVRHTEDSPGAF